MRSRSVGPGRTGSGKPCTAHRSSRRRAARASATFTPTGAPRRPRSHGNGARGLRPARRLRTTGRKRTGSVGRDREYALHHCELLPLLRALGGIEVEVEGEPPDYRDVGESLEIAISTAEVAGERDWFDLGVTITRRGPQLPFAEVFTALADGQSHMLLADGAHFSLDDPRLHRAARADRGGRGAARTRRRRRCGSAATRRPVGRARRARRRRPSRPQALAAAGRGAARARRARRSHEPPATLERRAPALPARRVRLARVALGARARRHPRRRHGPRQDAADPRPRLPRREHATRASARSSSSRRRASSRTGRARPPGSRPGCASSPVDRHGARSRGADDRGARAGADVVVTTYTLLRLDADAYARASSGRACPRRGAVREEPPGQDVPLRPASSTPRSSSRSPARRWRTT